MSVDAFIPLQVWYRSPLFLLVSYFLPPANTYNRCTKIDRQAAVNAGIDKTACTTLDDKLLWVFYLSVGVHSTRCTSFYSQHYFRLTFRLKRYKIHA